MKIKTIAHRIYGNRLFKDSLWTLFGNAFGKGLTVLSGIIVARLLGKDVYGEFGLLRNTLIIIAVFSTMGLGYTATVFISEAKEKTKNIVYPLVKVIELMTVIFSGLIFKVGLLFVLLFARMIFLLTSYLLITLLNGIF